MHILGTVGQPRRLADTYHYPTFHGLQPLNAFITYCAIGMVASQIIFAINFIYSIFYGPLCGAIPGMPTRWNGRPPARRATATSISSRSSTAGRTNTARRKSTPITIRRLSRRRTIPAPRRPPLRAMVRCRCRPTKAGKATLPFLSVEFSS